MTWTRVIPKYASATKSGLIAVCEDGARLVGWVPNKGKEHKLHAHYYAHGPRTITDWHDDPREVMRLYEEGSR